MGAKPEFERFIEKLEIIPGGCWLWRSTLDIRGYGQFAMNGVVVYAHRWAYENLVGPITEDTLDHLCRVHNCVNPRHLEPVSRGENVRRGSDHRNWNQPTCIHGHPWVDPYFYRRANGTLQRNCRECRRESNARSRAAKQLTEASS